MHQSDTTPLSYCKIGTEFLDECRDLLFSHDQDAKDFYLPLTNRSRAWVKGLRINNDIYNNTPTQLIGMSPNEAVKQALKGKKIIARPSVKNRRPIGYNEPLLPSHTK
ncbi:6656_t:CDS:2, partial [Cetraspora pellucida]